MDPRPCACGDTSRRRALKLILGGALATVSLPRALAGAGVGSAHLDVLLGDVADFPPGSVKAARFHGMPVLVLNLGGAVEVLSAICTHEACTVAWDAEQEILLCPCHGGQYDRHGTVMSGPPPAPLLRFPVRVADGKIYVVE